METVVTGEVLDGSPTVEDVNQHFLEKLDQLILKTEDSEEIKALGESLARYNTSIRNNDIFTQESEEERINREISKNIQDAIHG